MENLSATTRAIKKPSISISLFANLSESFSFDTKSSSSASKSSPRNFRGGGHGVVGLGIVAAMTTDSSNFNEAFASANPNFAASPKSIPIPIVSSAKAAANFRGGRNFGDLHPDDDDDDDGDDAEDEAVDELSESYTCVIAHHGNNLVTKRVYFGDNKLNNGGFDNGRVVTCSGGVFSASPANIGELETEFWTSDFLNSCFLCKKQLHGLDIFMYRSKPPQPACTRPQPPKTKPKPPAMWWAVCGLVNLQPAIQKNRTAPAQKLSNRPPFTPKERRHFAVLTAGTDTSEVKIIKRSVGLKQ